MTILVQYGQTFRYLMTLNMVLNAIVSEFICTNVVPTDLDEFRGTQRYTHVLQSSANWHSTGTRDQHNSPEWNGGRNSIYDDADLSAWNAADPVSTVWNGISCRTWCDGRTTIYSRAHLSTWNDTSSTWRLGSTSSLLTEMLSSTTVSHCSATTAGRLLRSKPTIVGWSRPSWRTGCTWAITRGTNGHVLHRVLVLWNSVRSHRWDCGR